VADFAVIVHLHEPGRSALTPEEMEIKILALFVAHVDASVRVSIRSGTPDALIDELSDRDEDDPDLWFDLDREPEEETVPGSDQAVDSQTDPS